MAITQTSSYDKWKYINTGTSAQNVRAGAGTGYKKLTSLPMSLVGNLYNVRSVETASNGIDWVEIEYSSGKWGWCAVKSQDVNTGKWYYYWEFYSSGSASGYGGYAYEYYYWPSTPTSYSSTPKQTYTFYPSNSLASSTYGDLGDFFYTSASGNVSLKKTVNGTTTTVQTASYSTTDTYTQKGWRTSKPSSITASSQVNLGGTFYFSVGDSSKSFYAVFNSPTSSTGFSNNVVNSITNPSNYTDTNTKYTLSFSDEYNTHSNKTATVTKTYSFTQWNYSNGNKVTFPITFTSNTTITAQYSLASTTYGKVTLPKPTKTNYIFEGWKDSSGNLYAGGTSYEVKSTHTLTAKWKLNNVKITLNNNKNWTGSYAPTGGGNYVPGTKVTINQPIKTGYHFVKWTNTSGTTIANTASYQLTVPPGDMTYTANIEANKYTIEYQKNNGTGSMSKSTHTYDTSQKLTRNAFTRVGYEFLGWSQNPKDKYPTYYDQQEVINLTTTNNGNIVLYAIWKPKGTVRISIDGNMTKKAQAYIFHDGAWHLAQPQTNYNNNWKINGG